MNIENLAKVLEKCLESGAIIQIKPNDYMILADFNGTFVEADSDPVQLLMYSFFKGLQIEENTRALKVSKTRLREALELTFRRDDQDGDSVFRPSFVTSKTEEFKQDFSQIKEAIEQGELKKAVPFIKSTAFVMPSPWDLKFMLLNMLERTVEGTYVYGVFRKTWGLLGATPELLFKKTGLQVETMSLAGSLPRSEGQWQALLEDPKEQFENQLVSDFLVQQMSHIGEVATGPLQIKELPTLWHLMREISVDLNAPVSVGDLVALLHPTPALGIASDKLDHHWLERLHFQLERGFFGAPLVLNYGQESLALVCIRNLNWENGVSVIRAGCGIVADSQFDKEWTEVNAKVESVRYFLGIK